MATHDSDGTLPAAMSGVLPKPPPDLAPGDHVGEYDVKGILGRGGFGVVYEALHPVIGKLVAIKVLNLRFSTDPAFVARFVAEARAVNQIRHRNIIDIFSFGQLPDGRQYYVMERLHGGTLAAHLAAKRRLTPGEALPLLDAVARALDAAHARGIAHRDLKPDNVFVADDDGEPYPKLLDFGIAKLLVADGGALPTATGSPVGTPPYMSPEQCRGAGVDHRTDVYSLGVMAYVMLTGRLPFTADSATEVMWMHMSAAPVPPSKVAAVPAALDAPVLHMLEKDPAARPASAGEAIRALAAAVAALPAVSPIAETERGELPFAATMVHGATPPRLATPVTGTARSPAAPPPRRWWIAALAATIVAGGVVAAVIAGQRGSHAPAAAPAPAVVPAPAAVIAADAAPRAAAAIVADAAPPIVAATQPDAAPSPPAEAPPHRAPPRPVVPPRKPPPKKPPPDIPPW